MYPTLTDCTYYRVVDMDEADSRVNGIEAKASDLAELREALCSAKETHLTSQHAAQDAEIALNNQLQNVQTCLLNEDHLRLQQESSRQETEQARADVRAGVQDANTAKDRERQAGTAAMDSKRQVEATARRLAFQESKLSQAEETVRELERQLQAARRNVESEQGECARMRTEARDASAHEMKATELLREAGRLVTDAQDRVAQAEDAVRDKHAREKEVAQLLIEAGYETSKQKTLKEECIQAVQASKELEHQKRAEEESASRAVMRGESELDSLNKAHKDECLRREMTNSEEQPLLEEEVMLRKQRECLEQREAQLNNNVSHLNGRTDRPSSPPRSAGGRSPDPLRLLSGSPPRSARR